MDRFELPLSQTNLSIAHAYNTLIITVSKEVGVGGCGLFSMLWYVTSSIVYFCE